MTFLAQLCGKRVLVVDQHRQLGHVGLYLGLPMVEYHFYDLVRNIDRMDADLLNGFVAHEVNGVDVLPGPDGLFGLTEVPLDAIQQTIRYLRGTYEYVVVDCSHGVGGANEPIIAESDQIYISGCHSRCTGPSRPISICGSIATAQFPRRQSKRAHQPLSLERGSGTQGDFRSGSIAGEHNHSQ